MDTVDVVVKATKGDVAVIAEDAAQRACRVVVVDDEAQRRAARGAASSLLGQHRGMILSAEPVAALTEPVSVERQSARLAETHALVGVTGVDEELFGWLDLVTAGAAALDGVRLAGSAQELRGSWVACATPPGIVSGAVSASAGIVGAAFDCTLFARHSTIINCSVDVEVEATA